MGEGWLRPRLRVQRVSVKGAMKSESERECVCKSESISQRSQLRSSRQRRSFKAAMTAVARGQGPTLRMENDSAWCYSCAASLP